MCALAIPGPDDQMTVYSSTQNPNGDQARIARALGVRANQVTVLVEQIGGGFGGKQHRAGIVGAQAAVAARALNRPVRLLYDRATDMLMVGKRHPYLGAYQVAYRPDGTIKGLQPRLQVGRRRHLRLLVRRHGPQPAPVRRLLSDRHAPGQRDGLPDQQAEQHGLPHLRHASSRSPCSRTRSSTWPTG